MSAMADPSRGRMALPPLHEEGDAMTHISGRHAVRRGTDRLFPQINNLLTLSASLGIAISYVAQGHVESNPGDYVTAECKQFALEVRLPFHGPVQAAVANRTADEIELNFVPRIAGAAHPINVSVLNRVMVQIIAPAFAMFFEEHVDWLKANHGRDGASWPSTLDFARAIRNAASHGMKLTFERSTSRPVQWHHLRYSFAENDREVIGGDLSFGDMLVLMFEVADELD
jgi:hypothetical protein